MYVVIFRAKASNLDEEYSLMAGRMQDLAINEYGCIEFSSCTEGSDEIALSYWHDLDAITRWKNNIEHLAAQKKGGSTWYQSYKVEIAKIERSYGGGGD